MLLAAVLDNRDQGPYQAHICQCLNMGGEKLGYIQLS